MPPNLWTHNGHVLQNDTGLDTGFIWTRPPLLDTGLGASTSDVTSRILGPKSVYRAAYCEIFSCYFAMF